MTFGCKVVNINSRRLEPKGEIKMVVKSRETIKVDVLKEGMVYLDGGSLFGVMPRPLLSKVCSPNRQNRIGLMINITSVRHPEGNVIINTGLGNKLYLEVEERYGRSSASKLKSELRKSGLSQSKIDYVVLPTLDCVSAGGVTSFDTLGNLTLTYPKATHIVHRRAWEDAHNLNELSAEIYGPGIEDLDLIERKGKLRLVDDDEFEILPFVKGIAADGPKPGHFVVEIIGGSEKFMHFSSLIPTPLHLNGPCITAQDCLPFKTLENKKRLIDKVRREGHIALFPLSSPSGREAGGYINTGNRLSPIDVWSFD